MVPSIKFTTISRYAPSSFESCNFQSYFKIFSFTAAILFLQIPNSLDTCRINLYFRSILLPTITSTALLVFLSLVFRALLISSFTAWAINNVFLNLAALKGSTQLLPIHALIFDEVYQEYYLLTYPYLSEVSSSRSNIYFGYC